MSDISRRGFIAAAGGAVAAVWLTADAASLLASGRHASLSSDDDPFKFLTADQAADLDAATSQLIPSDGTPGAHEARVVYFIDQSLATWAKEQRPVFSSGIAELRKRASAAVPGATSFASLTAEQQRAVIASLEKDKHQFFFALRGATIVGMFANPEYGGNADKTGWKLIGFDDRFSWAPPFGWYDAHA